MNEYSSCQKCGTTVNRGSNLCIKCKSDMLLPQCSYFEYRHRGYLASVPWCNKNNSRAITKKGLKCRWCKENKRSEKNRD